MTKKIKLLLLLLFTSGFLLNSCDKDFEVDSSLNANQNSYNSNLKVSKVYFDDFKENTDLLNKIAESTVKNKLVQNQRLVHSADDSFYIDTDYAYFIEDEDGKHSYTFQIIRQNSQYPLENLIVAQNDSLVYNLYVAQYDINASEFAQLSNGQHPNISDKIIISPLSNTAIDINTLLSRGSGENMCWTETVIPGNTCPGSEHHTLEDVLSGAVCPYFSSGTFTLFATHIIYTYGPCGEDSGGGGDGPIGGDNPDNPGDTGGGGNITTTPTLPGTVTSRPCAELKKISDKPQFVTNMQALKANISGTKEKGFIIRDKEGADAFSPIVEGDVDGNVTYPYADTTPNDIDNLWKSIGTGHNHLNSQIGIFSPEDLENLHFNGSIETNQANPNKSRAPTKAVIFVITDKGFFALKINDATKLFAFCNFYASMSLDDKKNYLKKTFQNPDVYNIRPDSSHDELVTGFLRFIEDKDIGVDLYRGNVNNFNSFEKLSLLNFGYGEESYSFMTEPCN